jgi:hypothetical protein
MKIENLSYSIVNIHKKLLHELSNQNVKPMIPRSFSLTLEILKLAYLSNSRGSIMV